MIFSKIVWTVDPVIFHIGSFGIRWYSILFGIGFYLGYMIVRKIWKDRNYEEEQLEKLVIYTFFGTLLGARLGHVIFYQSELITEDPLSILLPFHFRPHFEFAGFQGLASHGGAVGVMLALVLFHRRVMKINLIELMDMMVVGVIVTSAFIRFGNLMNHEIVGKPTDVAWGFQFTKGSRDIANIVVHPAQLYEALSYLSIFVLLRFLYWKKEWYKMPGKLFGTFLVTMFTARFLIEFVKNSQGGIENAIGQSLSTGQLLSIPFVLVGIYFLAFRKPANSLAE